MDTTNLSKIPQTEKLLNEERITQWFSQLSRPLVTNLVRGILDETRQDLLAGKQLPSYEALLDTIEARCVHKRRQRIIRVINATGIILHTNMGRAPLPEDTWQASREVNCGYSNLEYNLEAGKRGKRNGLIPELLSILVGSEHALIVNNNAAAVYLILNTFAQGKEVIVSRGEQVQIGGGFRIPEILRLSGATLREIGTTNITTLDDYKNALTDDTAVLLQVHRSNFAIHGFTKEPQVKELDAILPPHTIHVVDQGSGVISENIAGETQVSHYLKQGADLVCFSGDKILGGPQAGCIVGKKELIDRLNSHPLMRTFRAGKTIYSLLEDFLIRKLNGKQGAAQRLFTRSPDEMRKIARKIMYKIDRRYVSVVESTMSPGGGSSPDAVTTALSIRLHLPGNPQKISARLREFRTPIISVIEDEHVHLNLATIENKDAQYIREAITTLIEECSSCT
jgi:L-seryl-tRNA(Ser) seleniumtransferase